MNNICCQQYYRSPPAPSSEKTIEISLWAYSSSSCKSKKKKIVHGKYSSKWQRNEWQLSWASDSQKWFTWHSSFPFTNSMCEESKDLSCSFGSLQSSIHLLWFCTNARSPDRRCSWLGVRSSLMRPASWWTQPIFCKSSTQQ